MTNQEILRVLFKDEAIYQLSESVLADFVDCMEELELNTYDILTHCGTIDTNIYIVKDGIVRMTYIDGMNEVTRMFAHTGSMFCSWHSYYYHKPAFYQVEACCKSTILRIKKSDFDNLISKSHDFAQWLISMLQCNLYFFEMKNAIINGDAKTKFIQLVKNRPEILQKVPLKIIASYLEITPSYLSRLRHKILEQHD